MLIDDAGYRGLVILNQMTGITPVSETDDEVVWRVAAGTLLDDLIRESVTQGLWGLENLSGIPGTVGATPIQNVGAYGVEVSDVIVRIHAMHLITQEEKVFTNQDCAFSYRDSFLKTRAGRDLVITAVDFSFSKIARPKLAYKDLAELAAQPTSQPAIRDHVIRIRSQKFPDWTDVGTAGSFFKNPVLSKAQFWSLQLKYADLPGHDTHSGQVKVPLGWILDHVCKLRGYCEGNVCLYEKQALVLVRNGDATADEIKKFAKKISEIVFEKTKIKIETEVCYL